MRCGEGVLFLTWEGSEEGTRLLPEKINILLEMACLGES